MFLVVCPLPIVVFFLAIGETALAVLESCLPAALVDGLSRLQTHQGAVAVRPPLGKFALVPQVSLTESICSLAVVQSSHEGAFVSVTVGQIDGLIAFHLPPFP
jgi:hypothetical protein